MPNYIVFSGKELVKFLAKFGFIEIRIKGSHAILQKVIDNSTITIPVPLHKEIKKGTLLSIIRQSGLPKEYFIA